MTRLLIIGFGNEARGDDAAGPMIADAVERWHLQEVSTIVCHQLAPELADAVSKAAAVLFVDAAVNVASVTWEPLAADPPPQGLTHHVDPRAVLAFSRAVFGNAPAAWLVRVPARQLALGDPISQVTQAGVDSVLDQLRQLWASAGAGQPWRPPGAPIGHSITF